MEDAYLPSNIGDSDASDHPQPETTISPVTQDRITQWLSANNCHFFKDEEGHIGGFWLGRLVYFYLYGNDNEILMIRSQWNREAHTSHDAFFLELCNRWNAEKIWPKVFVRKRDDDMLQIVAEVVADFCDGATDEQISQVIQCGLATSMMLYDFLDEKFPDPLKAPHE